MSSEALPSSFIALLLTKLSRPFHLHFVWSLNLVSLILLILFSLSIFQCEDVEFNFEARNLWSFNCWLRPLKSLFNSAFSWLLSKGSLWLSFRHLIAPEHFSVHHHSALSVRLIFSLRLLTFSPFLIMIVFFGFLSKCLFSKSFLYSADLWALLFNFGFSGFLSTDSTLHFFHLLSALWETLTHLQ